VLILDTCTLLWLAAEQVSLSAKAIATIKDYEHALHVSAITAFEIGTKARTKKLALPLEPARWYEETLKLHGIQEIPLNGSLLAHSTMLPLHHSDPADRIIIATAKLYQLTILTPDPEFDAYKVLRVW